jgi:hypothetical protein
MENTSVVNSLCRRWRPPSGSALSRGSPAAEARRWGVCRSTCCAVHGRSSGKTARNSKPHASMMRCAASSFGSVTHISSAASSAASPTTGSAASSRGRTAGACPSHTLWPHMPRRIAIHDRRMQHSRPAVGRRHRRQTKDPPPARAARRSVQRSAPFATSRCCLNSVLLAKPATH